MFEFIVISLLHAFSFTSPVNSVAGTGNGGWGHDVVGTSSTRPTTSTLAASSTSTTPTTAPGTGNGGWGHD